MKRRGMNNRETNMIYTLTHPLQLLYECLPHVRRSACCCCCRIRLYAMSSIQYYIIVFSLSLSLSAPLGVVSSLGIHLLLCRLSCSILARLVASCIPFFELSASLSLCVHLCLTETLVVVVVVAYVHGHTLPPVTESRISQSQLYQKPPPTRAPCYQRYHRDR